MAQQTINMSGKGKLIGWSVVLVMWSGMSYGLQYMANKEKDNSSEVINTAEDIIEWIEHDLEGGYIDSSKANDYIYNLEQIIKEIK